MNDSVIVTGTVTYALKGRNILRDKGYKAGVKRLSSSLKGVGCGYAIEISGDDGKAVEILKRNGVKILKIINKNDL